VSPRKHFEAAKEQGESQKTLQLERVDSVALNLSQEASMVYAQPESIMQKSQFCF